MSIRKDYSLGTPVETLAEAVIHVAGRGGNISSFLQSRYPKEIERILDIVRGRIPIQGGTRRKLIEVLFNERDSGVLQPYLQKPETIDKVSPDIIEMMRVNFIEKYLNAIGGEIPPTAEDLNELRILYLEGNIYTWITLESLSHILGEYHQDTLLNAKALFSCIQDYGKYGHEYIMELRDDAEKIRQQEKLGNNP